MSIQIIPKKLRIHIIQIYLFFLSILTLVLTIVLAKEYKIRKNYYKE